MTLRKNDDDEWTMPRGLSFRDMAHEITDAVRGQASRDWPLNPPPDLTIARRYGKVTVKGKRPCPPIRRPTSG